ncbi:MAG: phosphoesterase [Acidobacteria bacterium]|nr:MAG: phosphoesterase [Acidobacteriota bacterium]
MVTERLYRDDPYRLEFDATVVARRRHRDRPAVVLDRTAFYAESGGQPWDTGTLDGASVVAVVEQEGEILHVLDSPVTDDRVHGRVDGPRRLDHMQQHHGQHLLSRALVEVAAARTVSFHLGAEDVLVDLDRLVSDDELRRAETRANEIVWQARPVTVRIVTPAEAESLLATPIGRLHGAPAPDERAQARSAHALAEAGNAVRLVEAAGFDLQACSGQGRVAGAIRLRSSCAGRDAPTAAGAGRAGRGPVGGPGRASPGGPPAAGTAPRVGPARAGTAGPRAGGRGAPAPCRGREPAGGGGARLRRVDSRRPARPGRPTRRAGTLRGPARQPRRQGASRLRAIRGDDPRHRGPAA